MRGFLSRSFTGPCHTWLLGHGARTPRTAIRNVRGSYLQQHSLPSRRFASELQERPQPADQPGFESLLDQPPLLVKVRRKHGKGALLLAAMPILAFGLGTWQIFRLDWKNDMIAKFEDRLVRAPLALPSRIDPDHLAEFDYRRVYATGKWRHDLEMLLGPRVRDGKSGFFVITPLERGGEGTTILVNRGWIPQAMKEQKDRPLSLTKGTVTVEGLLRDRWKKNMFTPDNKPEENAFYFPNVDEMASLAGSQPVWVEETMEPNLLKAYDREAAGVPIGRIAEVNIRNNHLQYIFTWYALSAATSIMLWMVLRRPSRRRVRQSIEW